MTPASETKKKKSAREWYNQICKRKLDTREYMERKKSAKYECRKSNAGNALNAIFSHGSSE
jgi:hypothetical protein